MSNDIEEPVPKLPRGRGIKLSGPELFRILLTLFTLVALIMFTKPCANTVSSFVTSFSGSAGSAMPKPGNVEAPQHYEQLKPGMSEQEIKDAIERSKRAGSAAPATQAK